MTKIHLWRMEDRLIAIDDGNLSQRKRTSLKLHLTECSHCRERLARIKRTSEMLKGSRPEADKPAFEDRIQTSFQDALNRTNPTPIFLPVRTPQRMIAVACTAFIIFSVGFELSLRRPDKSVRVVAQLPNVEMENSPLTRQQEPTKKIVLIANKPDVLGFVSSKKTPFFAKTSFTRHRKHVFASNSRRRRKHVAEANAEMIVRTDALATALWANEREAENLTLAVKSAMNDEPHLIVRVINPVELDVVAVVVERPNPALPAYVEATTLTSNAQGRSSWRQCKLIKNGNFITNETIEGESKWGEQISHLSLSITKLVPVATGKLDAGKEMK